MAYGQFYNLFTTFSARWSQIYLFSGYFLLGTAFTDHRVLGADLIMSLKKTKRQQRFF